MPTPTESGEPSASSAPILVLLFCLAVGVAAGLLIGATKTTDGGGFGDVSWATMTEQPLGDADKVFNWLLFSVFACTGIISACVLSVGAKLTRR